MQECIYKLTSERFDNHLLGETNGKTITLKFDFFPRFLDLYPGTCIDDNIDLWKFSSKHPEGKHKVRLNFAMIRIDALEVEEPETYICDPTIQSPHETYSDDDDSFDKDAAILVDESSSSSSSSSSYQPIQGHKQSLQSGMLNCEFDLIDGKYFKLINVIVSLYLFEKL